MIFNVIDENFWTAPDIPSAIICATEKAIWPCFTTTRQAGVPLGGGCSCCCSIQCYRLVQGPKLLIVLARIAPHRGLAGLAAGFTHSYRFPAGLDAGHVIHALTRAIVSGVSNVSRYFLMRFGAICVPPVMLRLQNVSYRLNQRSIVR